MLHNNFNEKYKFVTLSCDKGEFITNFKDGDDIKGFSSFTIAYCPGNTDISKYRLISAEENEKYLALKKEEMEKELEDRKPKNN